MDMKKNILLSMILLALCLIQASADTYYYRIQLSNEKGEPGKWSDYIVVSHDDQNLVYHNGLRDLINGITVTDEKGVNYTLPKTADNSKGYLDRIYGIAFANGKGKEGNAQQNIMEGDEYEAWKKIRGHIKYLRLRDYIRDSYNDDSYLMYMDNVEELELPKNGMNVGSEADDGKYYFANAHKLNKITIWSDVKGDAVDITDDAVTDITDKKLLNIVGKFMFANCWALSTKYINRLIKGVTEIKDNAFFANDDNRKDLSDEADNTIIEIPSTVTKIGSQAFRNRVKVTGLNIHGNGGLEIGFEAFRGCDELANITLDNITPDNKELRIYKNAFRGCKQLKAFENLDKAKITYLETGVFGDCRSMTNEFVNGVLQNYADNGEETKIPAYLFYGCNGQDGHDGKDANKNKCSFTDLIIPAKFSQIGDGAFASSGDAEIKLETITVNRGVAPECLQGETDEYAGIKNKKVFEGLDPNMTTVIFKNAAEGWEETEATGFLTYMNDGSEFQRLLTKDLYSNQTEYINVPQQHAIVKLHRTLKEGWNTICLPFGVNYRYCSMWGEAYKNKQAYNASIIVNGLTHNSGATSDNFTMGVYRGYWKEGKTFMFLHYTNFDRYPLDFCETFLVKMRKQDIDNAEKDKNGVAIYTFTNVDLNYRWHADGTSGNEGNWTLVKAYPANEMLGQVKDFDGQVNTDATPFAGKASYNEYVLRGSLVQRMGTVGDSQGIITTKDYFFQSKNGTMKLYPYTDSQPYGIRGFSGWFHYEPNNSNSKPSELSLSLFDDGSITPIETVKVDDLNRDTSGKVYSISGVLMKNNAADLNNLPKGIYVVNGKKYVVK